MVDPMKVPDALVDLAAGRSTDVIDFPRFHEAAFDHRLAGYVTGCVGRGLVRLPASERTAFAVATLAQKRRSKELLSALEWVAGRLATAGFDVGCAKGVVAERLFYAGTGERAATDLDLFFDPDDDDRLDDLVAALQPDHPLVGEVSARARAGALETVDLRLPMGVWVDLHYDIMKWGLASRQRRAVWARTIPFELPSGRIIRTLNRDLSVAHFLLTLNRDRFRHLSGFVDVRLAIASGDVDWGEVERFGVGEGLGVHLTKSLRVVEDTLGIGPFPLATPGGQRMRSLAWDVLWRDGVRLSGAEGLAVSRRKHWWIPLTARGRIGEGLGWFLSRLFPPRSMVEFYYPNTKGPYLWTILKGRISDRIRWKKRALAGRERNQ